MRIGLWIPCLDFGQNSVLFTNTQNSIQVQDDIEPSTDIEPSIGDGILST